MPLLKYERLFISFSLCLSSLRIGEKNIKESTKYGHICGTSLWLPLTNLLQSGGLSYPFMDFQQLRIIATDILKHRKYTLSSIKILLYQVVTAQNLHRKAHDAAVDWQAQELNRALVISLKFLT